MYVLHGYHENSSKVLARVMADCICKYLMAVLIHNRNTYSLINVRGVVGFIQARVILSRNITPSV